MGPHSSSFPAGPQAAAVPVPAHLSPDRSPGWIADSKTGRRQIGTSLDEHSNDATLRRPEEVQVRLPGLSH